MRRPTPTLFERFKCLIVAVEQVKVPVRVRWGPMRSQYDAAVAVRDPGCGLKIETHHCADTCWSREQLGRDFDDELIYDLLSRGACGG